MYLWKCWRDTRSTFYVLVGAILAVGAFAGYVAWDPFGWIAAKAQDLRELWEGSAGVFVTMAMQLVPVAGFVLGALGVGTEFEKGTADFLLTRPRSRRYLLWTSWGLGAAQVVALVLGSVILRLVLANSPGAEDPGAFLRPVAILATLALLFYSVTYMMTTLARNSRHGTGLGLAAFSGYTGLYMWLRFWYDIHIPVPWNLLPALRSGEVFSIVPIAGWLTVAAAFMLIAQFRFERQEV